MNVHVVSTYLHVFHGRHGIGSGYASGRRCTLPAAVGCKSLAQCGTSSLILLLLVACAALQVDIRLSYILIGLSHREFGVAKEELDILIKSLF